MYLEDYPIDELVSLDESDVSPKLGVIYQHDARYRRLRCSIRTAFGRRRMQMRTSASNCRSSITVRFRIRI